MKLEVAKQLIEDGVVANDAKQTWADLGAGNGLFTNALSTLLIDGSTIYAVDTDPVSLKTICVRPGVALIKIQNDFLIEDWIIKLLTGVVMANSLHFVRDKELFLKKLKEKLEPGGRLIIVEYEMDAGNTWVPYPIGFNRLSELINRAGFSVIKKLNTVPSVYNNEIYSVLVE